MTGWHITRDPWWRLIAAAWTLSCLLMIGSAITLWVTG